MQMLQIIGISLIKLLDIITWLIVIQCLMSWFPGARYSKVYEIISMFTEPLVGPIRNILFKYIDIPIDFSPIIAFFAISMIQKLIAILIW